GFAPSPWTALSSGVDGCTALAQEALLLVVEADVRLVEQRHVEIEPEVAVGGLQEGEARVPAVQVALQPDRVLAELARVHVVLRAPRRRPLWRGTEGEVDLQRLLASLRRHRREQRVRPGEGAHAGGGIGDGEVESPSSAPA